MAPRSVANEETGGIARIANPPPSRFARGTNLRGRDVTLRKLRDQLGGHWCHQDCVILASRIAARRGLSRRRVAACIGTDSVSHGMARSRREAWPQAQGRSRAARSTGRDVVEPALREGESGRRSQARRVAWKSTRSARMAARLHVGEMSLNAAARKPSAWAGFSGDCSRKQRTQPLARRAKQMPRGTGSATRARRCEARWPILSWVSRS